ncbi:hypothetical protein HYN69_12395 [Gemmobacter aquarius]|uniref:Threonine/homoserine/homoserine lactone efflux protein n=1 Tax=Paragemmobacter aquarius TaxID=2169400 RepID=A0A2S0UN09_9RHOB|nr:LysE family translocator [Gemmobacter aquarius]AWB49196.1 hypothetical protein HYN69_12395 [Gemmobacter aquarius]
MQETLVALVGFAFVTSVTPGPNNMMLMASGANFGFRRTVPHMLGISLGHALMVFLVGMGVGEVFVAVPVLARVLEAAAVVYMLWLAGRIARSAAPEEGKAGGVPFSFLQAAGFQWVNPKAWAMALTATSVYAPEVDGGQRVWAMALVAVVFAAVNLPSVSVWTVLGREVARFLTDARRLRAFNWTMAGLLVLSLWPVVWPVLRG